MNNMPKDVVLTQKIICGSVFKGDEKMVEKLFLLQDLKYRDFHAKLMPTVDKEKIIGVRVPQLRKFAKSMCGQEEAEKFLQELPHEYYEENNLHAFLVEMIKDFDEAIAETERFLPYIDNWATCDMFYPKVFALHPEKMREAAKRWIESGKEYTVRYGIGILLRMDFKNEDMNLVARIKSEKYYVNMMIAWYFATALAKNYTEAVKYLREKRLEAHVHNKTIQKACESLRIDSETKKELRGMKR